MSLDSKIHHNNLINNILAKIEANHAGADAGLMLDKDGFVSEANGVNVFCIRKGIVYTPHADSCLPGITRQHVINLCREQGIPIIEKNLSLTEFYTADQVFTTGTMGELTKVAEIDGRAIRSRMEEDLLEQIKGYFRAMTRSGGEPLPF
jgi:branched-chain amino acid aminotransferase